jgi:hypothetical protein
MLPVAASLDCVFELEAPVPCALLDGAVEGGCVCAVAAVGEAHGNTHIASNMSFPNSAKNCCFLWRKCIVDYVSFRQTVVDNVLDQMPEQKFRLAAFFNSA